ncbi:RagB/SusD family nutrient uptake outer membrane protein [Draconibacterium sp.]
MKNIKKLSIAMVLLIMLTISNSCSDEFLNKEPWGVTSESIFYTEKGCQALLNGCYGVIGGGGQGLGYDWGASVSNWSFGSAASDDAYKGSEVTDQIPANDVEKWELISTNGYVSQKWRWAIGVGADRVNKTLRILKITEEKNAISAAVAKEIRAEARFIRAFHYFEARLLYGDYLPILTEDIVDVKTVSNVNPDGAILNFIIDDLKFAWENLPESQGTQVGRPTKYAAMALAAKAYMQDLKYAEAKPLLDNIINSGKFELMPKFIQNYEIATNNNKESIFEIQNSVNDGGGTGSFNGEMGIGLNWPHGGDIGFCCGFHQPSQNLVNAYKVDANGLPLFNTFNDVDFKNDQGIFSEDEFVPDDQTPVDPRLDFTVSRRGIPYKDWGVNRGAQWIRKQSEGGPYLPAPKPFLKKSEVGSFKDNTGGWMSGVNANNFRYIRYAHVLLWRAEIAASENDLPKALELVNRIRERAANDHVMGKVKATKLPVDFYPWGDSAPGVSGNDIDWSKPAANYKIGTYTSFANKEQAMTAVQWETRLEFATEGMRFFDLRRWDKLPNKIGGKSMAEILNGFATTDLRIRKSFMSGANFSETDKWVPVPQTQIDLQPGVIEQRK